MKIIQQFCSINKFDKIAIFFSIAICEQKGKKRQERNNVSNKLYTKNHKLFKVEMNIHDLHHFQFNLLLLDLFRLFPFY